MTGSAKLLYPSEVVGLSKEELGKYVKSLADDELYELNGRMLSARGNFIWTRCAILKELVSRQFVIIKKKGSRGEYQPQIDSLSIGEIKMALFKFVFHRKRIECTFDTNGKLLRVVPQR